jgi:hypothetical protein
VPPGRPAATKPRQDRPGLGARELRPGRSGSARRAADSDLVQNFPRRRRRYLHSQGGQLAVDPAVPPFGVLAGQPQDQGTDGAAGRRPAARAAHGPGGPAAADDAAVPAHDRVRVTSSRSPGRRALGITPGRAASRARSAQFTFGRRGCRRCAAASWWRRIKICAVCHGCSRRDSRSHEATRVIRRKTNRRHMIGDHHGRTAGRATLLVKAADAILGTHRISAARTARSAQSSWGLGMVRRSTRPRAAARAAQRSLRPPSD